AQRPLSVRRTSNHSPFRVRAAAQTPTTGRRRRWRRISLPRTQKPAGLRMPQGGCRPEAWDARGAPTESACFAGSTWVASFRAANLRETMVALDRALVGLFSGVLGVVTVFSVSPAPRGGARVADRHRGADRLRSGRPDGAPRWGTPGSRVGGSRAGAAPGGLAGRRARVGGQRREPDGGERARAG